MTTGPLRNEKAEPVIACVERAECHQRRRCNCRDPKDNPFFVTLHLDFRTQLPMVRSETGENPARTENGKVFEFFYKHLNRLGVSSR